MRSRSTEEQFYMHMCIYFEFHRRPELLKEKIASILSLEKQRLPFQKIYDSLLVNEMEVDDQNQTLIGCMSETDLREKLLYMLGYHGREADRLLNSRTSYFHRSKRNLSRIILEDAIQLAALLETIPTVLLPQNRLHSANEKDVSWFHYSSVLEKSIEDFKSASEDSGKREHFQYGRIWIEELSEWVGITVIQLPSYVEISLTVDDSAHVALSKWDKRLHEMASNIGLDGIPVFTVSAPFLSSGRTRIYRMSWVRNSSARARIRLHTRIFSTRTEEVTFYMNRIERNIKYPIYKRMEVSHVLGVAVYQRLVKWKEQSETRVVGEIHR